MITILKKTVIKEKIKIFSSGIPFNPLNSPNTVALWDGDQQLDLNDTWNSQVNGADQINFTSSGTLPLTGGLLNGHNTIIFNGVDQYGVTVDPLIAQPYTIYLVVSQITSTPGNYFFSDGFACYRNDLLQTLANGTSIQTPGGTYAITGFNINQFVIVTIVRDGLNSGIRINSNLIEINNYGAVGNERGCTIGYNSCGDAFGNSEYAYIIMRDVADNTATQNLYINFLKARFAL